MKYFSMFSGIGGFEIPLQELGWECVGFSEIDKYAVSIYRNHFPTHNNFGDATKIIPSELPDFDLLCGGFPCQAFSVAGKRQGFDDTRGTLFFDIARILREKRPRLLLLENVKGLLSHDSGRTFKVIITTLAELGYDCQWQVLNAKDFGVPQNRERVFIVGHLRGTTRPEVFPIGKTSSSNMVQETDGNIRSGIQTRENAISRRHNKTSKNINQYDVKQKSVCNTCIGTFRTHKDGNGFREVKSGLAPTIPARAREDGSGQPVIVVSRGKNPANPSDRTTGAPTEQRLEPNTQGIANTLTNVQKDNWLLQDMQ
jgi:DNA (cytosine-5)-methyltransferase 1